MILNAMAKAPEKNPFAVCCAGFSPRLFRLICCTYIYSLLAARLFLLKNHHRHHRCFDGHVSSEHGWLHGLECWVDTLKTSSRPRIHHDFSMIVHDFSKVGFGIQTLVSFGDAIHVHRESPNLVDGLGRQVPVRSR